MAITPRGPRGGKASPRGNVNSVRVILYQPRNPFEVIFRMGRKRNGSKRMKRLVGGKRGPGERAKHRLRTEIVEEVAATVKNKPKFFCALDQPSHYVLLDVSEWEELGFDCAGLKPRGKVLAWNNHCDIFVAESEERVTPRVVEGRRVSSVDIRKRRRKLSKSGRQRVDRQSKRLSSKSAKYVVIDPLDQFSPSHRLVLRAYRRWLKKTGGDFNQVPGRLVYRGK